MGDINITHVGRVLVCARVIEEEPDDADAEYDNRAAEPSRSSVCKV